MNVIVVEGVVVGNCFLFVLFGGLNVFEDFDLILYVVEYFIMVMFWFGILYVFKVLFDKVNCFLIKFFCGVGLDEGLCIFEEVKCCFGVLVIIDVYEVVQVVLVVDVVDVLQIFVFLVCQIDLVVVIVQIGCVVNIKKLQFFSFIQIIYIVFKICEVGNEKIILCECGVQFGYDNLVVDMFGFCEMIEFIGGLLVIFDVIYSLQCCDVGSEVFGGCWCQVVELVWLGMVLGLVGLFLEVYCDLDYVCCDGFSVLLLVVLELFLIQIKVVDDLVKGFLELDIC